MRKAIVTLRQCRDRTRVPARDRGVCRRRIAFTMEQELYKQRFERGFDLDILVADAHDRAVVHRVIYDVLVQGRVQPGSREAYRNVAATPKRPPLSSVVKTTSNLEAIAWLARAERRLLVSVWPPPRPTR
jgi:hypothetical protein